MDDLRLDPGRPRDAFVKLVPRQHLVRGDVKRVTDRPAISKQPDEALGEIAVVGDRPERVPVARHDDLRAAPHARDDGVRFPPAVDHERNQPVAVGQRGPDDDAGECFLAQRRHQRVLRRDLVARILPERIHQRRVLADDVIQQRLLIGAGRADEDVLAGAAPEERDVALDVGGVVSDPVDHGVEVQTFDCSLHLGRVLDVGLDPFSTGWNGGGFLTAVEQVELDAALERQPGRGDADVARPADEENFHDQPILSFSPPSVILWVDIFVSSFDMRKCCIFAGALFQASTPT